jgi:hypothetical protein
MNIHHPIRGLNIFDQGLFDGAEVNHETEFALRSAGGQRD